jgi:hypothetical protein
VIVANKRNIKNEKEETKRERERENETVTDRQYCRVRWQKYETRGDMGISKRLIGGRR